MIDSFRWAALSLVPRNLPYKQEVAGSSPALPTTILIDLVNLSILTQTTPSIEGLPSYENCIDPQSRMAIYAIISSAPSR